MDLVGVRVSKLSYPSSELSVDIVNTVVLSEYKHVLGGVRVWAGKLKSTHCIFVL